MRGWWNGPDIFYLLESSSKLTWIITCFQTSKHEKLIITFFTRYFPFLSICRRNLRSCWKLLRAIIYFLELEKLIITSFFLEKKWKMWIGYNLYILKNVSIYTDISYTYISIYRTQYIDISDISIYRCHP